jgi:hypothetical protein
MTTPTLSLDRLQTCKRLRAAFYSALHDASAARYPRTFLESLREGIAQAEKDVAYWSNRAGIAMPDNVVPFKAGIDAEARHDC